MSTLIECEFNLDAAPYIDTFVAVIDLVIEGFFSKGEVTTMVQLFNCKCLSVV